MTDELDANDGFATLIRKTPDAGDADPRGGVGIAQTKSDQQVSGYRDLVRRQLEKRKIVKNQNNDTIPSPTPINISSSSFPVKKTESSNPSSTSSKSSIDTQDIPGSIPSTDEIKPQPTRSNISIEDNDPYSFSSHSSISSIEENVPIIITSIENINPDSAPASGSDISIEEIDPSLGNEETQIPPFSFNGLYSPSENLSTNQVAQGNDRVTESHFERNSASPKIFHENISVNLNSDRPTPGSNNSIEVNKPVANSNSSIEDSDPLKTAIEIQSAPIEVYEPRSIASIEDIELSQGADDPPNKDGPFSSIEVFEPIIPLSDKQVYSVKLNGNYTKLAHSVFKHAGKLDAKTLYLYLFLYRMSYGWNKNTTQIPLSQYYIKNALNYSKNTVVKCLQKLSQLDLLQQKEVVAGLGSFFHVRYFSVQGEIQDDVPDKNFLALDNNFFELETLSTTAKIIYLYLYKESFGFGSNHTGRLLTSEIAKHLNLTTRTIQEAIRELLEKKIISRPDEIFSSNGILYRVLLPQEIQLVKNKTPIEFKKKSESGNHAGWGSKLSIEENAPGLIPSIETNHSTRSSNSIEEIDRHEIISPQQNDISNLSASKSKSSIEVSAHNETKENSNKTSSGQVDDVFKFFNQQTKRDPNFKFAISQAKISALLQKHEQEYLKSTFTKMLPVLIREGVTNPVGLYLHALETPESYVVMQKPSVEEIAERKRYENQIELREKSFADEFKRIIDSKQESFWDELDERIREGAIAKRRVELGAGQGGELKIPEVAIKRSAIERTFWDRHRELWQSLTESERAARASTVKQTIIKRVYAGEGRAIPDSLPEREFLKSIDEYAEKLAMVSVGKGKQNESN